MTGAAPSGVVTFLFTDVEGSTRRWETDADLMRMALAARFARGEINETEYRDRLAVLREHAHP
jgi:class 3 adenylate cyclase